MTLWSFAVPVFEAPDEQAHWQYARYLRVNKKLPLYNQGFVEANSPPLYYLLVAPFASYSDIPPSLSWNGPEGRVIPTLPRLYQNSNSDYLRYWPVRVVRLVTILISLVTVFFSFASGVEATGRRTTGLLAGSLAAFLPQFTFRGMNVSNDAMVTAFGAVVLYCLVRMVRHGVTWRRALVAAVAIAAAFLSKTNALFFPLPFAVAVVTERIGWRGRLKYLTLIGVSIALAAPWLIRNQVLYGDPLAQKAMLTAVASLVRPKPLTSPYFTQVFPRYLAYSLVGVYGWLALWSPKRVYHFFWLIGAVGFAGCAIGLIRRRMDFRLLAVVALIPLLNLIVVVYINLMFDQPQGRYMFPSLPAMALLVALGLESIPFWRARLSTGLAAALALVNVYVLVGVVWPGYWPAPNLALSEAAKTLVPASAAGVPGDELRLAPVESGAASGSGEEAKHPQFVFKMDAAASQYNYFTCTLRGPAERGLVTGALYLRFCSGEDAAPQKVQFKWICDGTDQPVIVALWMLPDWGGRLSEIRVDPDDSGVLSRESRVLSPESGQPSKLEPVRGSGSAVLTVRIGSPAIVGSLTPWRGP